MGLKKNLLHWKSCNKLSPTNSVCTTCKNCIPFSIKSYYTLAMRTIFSIILIGYFCLTVYLGPFAIIITTLVIQIKCFFELIDIVYNMYEMQKVSYHFRFITWYFLITANYFFCAENAIPYFYIFIEELPLLKFFVLYHRFLSFLIYLIGVVWFVLSLKQKYYRWQFTLLAWTHVALLVIVSSSSMIIKIVFEGLIWVIISVMGSSSMIIKIVFEGLIWVIISVMGTACNDIGAYTCGKIFGRRPLIQLSPRKTWEGFIGAGIITIIYGFVVSTILCKYEYLVCPLEYRNISGQILLISECERSALFKLKTYSLEFLFGTSITTFPFVLHALCISLFGSIIAPFGGFFASGFKRAFKVKDFGTAIPGHGGILDRFDCQIFMTIFVNVYISTFVREPSVEKIFSRILAMKNEHQIEFLYLFRNYLQNNGLSINRTHMYVS
ncbi:hypothetical protein QE152_g6727 [Popillia japonica]|uniref:Phosphatidate cytidylyltransferase n=1 Tax=Popillia japonica TaxID=7064 RepID=A0AAW1MG30_POPJA